MKNLLLLATFLCTATAVQAQLFVKPNGSTDSYVYVNDEVLFVEQDVNLVANNPGTTEASIYLRNEAQLIQGGNPGSTNSGTGTLSVYQDSHSDAYDYNYWCSPVGLTINTGNQNFGITKFNDIVDVTDSNVALTTTNYNGSSTPLTISSRWIYKWNHATQRWVYVAAANTIPAGYGFTMKGTDVTVHGDPYNDIQNQVYDFRGRPNNGNITIPLETSGVLSQRGIPDYFSLTGNPYPSALDLNLVFYDSDNLEIENFKYWDEDRSVNSHLYVDNKGGYGTWVPGVDPYGDGGDYTRPTFMNYDSAGNPTTSTGNLGAYKERLYAPIGQGFMIVGDPANPYDSQIIIKNTHRAYVKEGASNFSEFLAPTTMVSKLRLHVIFGEYTHYRDMLLTFSPMATKRFDRGLDASHPLDAASADAYFPQMKGGNKKLVIEALPFDINMMIPIAFKLDSQQKIQLKVAEAINKQYNKVYLLDRLTELKQEIKMVTNNNEELTATVVLPAGEYTDRFYIVFSDGSDDESPSVTHLISETVLDIEFVQNNPSKLLEISNRERYNVIEVSIFDMSGKLLLISYNLGNNNNFQLPTSQLSDGVYLVKLTTAEHGTITHRITVFNK